MKNLTILLLLCFAVVTGNAQDLRLLDTKPQVVFAYPDDVAVIKDQSKVATVVSNKYYHIVQIDGVKVRYNGITKNENALRRTKSYNSGDYGKPDQALDLLPGKHTLSITYSENIWMDEKKKKYYAYSTSKPIDFEMEFEAGCVYQIRAIIINNSLMGVAIDKGLQDESYREKIIEARNEAKY